MKYAAPPPPPSSSTAATILISFFFDFFVGSASTAFAFSLMIVNLRFGGSVGGRGQQCPLAGRQRGQDHDVNPAVHRRCARVAGPGPAPGTGGPGRRQPVGRA